MSTSFHGFPKNDAKLINQWWRFIGIGGDRVIASCIGLNIGGTSHGVHIPFTYPTNESLSEETGAAYADYIYQCDNRLPAQVSVAYCPGGFYVYKPLTLPYANMGYVTCKW